VSGLLRDKVAFITGAGAGIGAAVAERFAAEGATLWLNDRDHETLATTIDHLRSASHGSGSEVSSLAGDASDSSFVDAWVTAGLETFDRVDVLYNNVGVSRPGLVGDLSDEDWHFQRRLTLDSVFFATRAVLAPMVDGGGGSIVSMASGAGIGGNYNLGGYAAAKAGVINLMETVATEHGRNGIRANAVAPGPTATPPLLAYLEQRPGGVDAHVADLNLARLTDPHEIAATVAWLASDQSSAISGTCVRANIRAASRRPPP